MNLETLELIILILAGAVLLYNFLLKRSGDAFNSYHASYRKPRYEKKREMID